MNVLQVENLRRVEGMLHWHMLYPVLMNLHIFIVNVLKWPRVLWQGTKVRKGPTTHNFLGESSGRCSKICCFKDTFIKLCHCFCHYLYCHCFLYLPWRISTYKFLYYLLPFVKNVSINIRYSVSSFEPVCFCCLVYILTNWRGNTCANKLMTGALGGVTVVQYIQLSIVASW